VFLLYGCGIHQWWKNRRTQAPDNGNLFRYAKTADPRGLSASDISPYGRWKTLGLSVNHPDLPRTIRDFMIVARACGTQYLWVDSLCRTQDDPADLEAQLDKMGDIYLHSSYTIVGAHGTDAEAGLPGVSENRTSHHSAKVQGMELVNFLPYTDQDLNGAWWNYRAWTCQERLMSPRMLAFSSAPAHLYCRHHLYCEEIEAPGHLDE
jgi:hypothetical protein